MYTNTKCPDRKSTRLNSSHLGISYAVFCLKKKHQGQGHGPDPTARACEHSRTHVARLSVDRGRVSLQPDSGGLSPTEESVIVFFFFKERATPLLPPLPLEAPIRD